MGVSRNGLLTGTIKAVHKYNMQMEVGGVCSQALTMRCELKSLEHLSSTSNVQPVPHSTDYPPGPRQIALALWKRCV